MRFFFHYSKPASQKAGKPMMSVHFRKTCHTVHTVNCQVACMNRVRKTQPHLVMAGSCREVLIEDGVATIK